MPQIPEPVKVSPLIKLFRYSFLAAGIMYGASKLKTLQVLEEGKKEERERRKIEREAKLVEEKKAAAERDIAAIVAIFKGSSEPESNAADQGFTPEITAATKIQGKDVTRLVQEDKLSTKDVTRLMKDDKPVSSNDIKDEKPGVTRWIKDDTTHSSLVQDDTSGVTRLNQDGKTSNAEDSSSCTAAEVKQVVQETFGVDDSASARTEFEKSLGSSSKSNDKDMFSSRLDLGKAKDMETAGGTVSSLSPALGTKQGVEEEGNKQTSLVDVEVKHEVVVEGNDKQKEQSRNLVGKVAEQLPKDQNGQDRV